jgi:hypothetical protein
MTDTVQTQSSLFQHLANLLHIQKVYAEVHETINHDLKKLIDVIIASATAIPDPLKPVVDAAAEVVVDKVVG